MAERALITGITGQDGSYLAEFLLEKGYDVAGLIRPNSCNSLGNINHLRGDVTLFDGDLLWPDSTSRILRIFKPDEIYNLAALSSPLSSFNDEEGTMMVDGIGANRVFRAAKAIVPDARIYQASTSEMFGVPHESPQNENTLFNPANPYAAAKVYAHFMANLARRPRQNGGNPQFISCGILFNHESPRRGFKFVTRKITTAVACIKNNVAEKYIPLNEIGQPIVQKGKLRLGDLTAERDWGYAPEYVRLMWDILQQKEADDFVIATGEVHTVGEWAREAFAIVGLDADDYIISDPHFIPPVQTGPLCGDCSKAERVLGKRPNTYFKELVRIMVKADLKKFS